MDLHDKIKKLSSVALKLSFADIFDRMFFSLCAVCADVNADTFEDLKARVSDALPFDILKESFDKIEPSFDVSADVIAEFCDAVHDVASADKKGEDVAGIFFSEFSRYKKKSDAGQVFTPGHIAKLATRLLAIDENDTVLDATCGSGTLLLTASYLTNCEIVGAELYRNVYALALISALINGVDVSKLRQMDAMSEDAADFIRDSNITKVLMNPPYERKYGCMKIVTNVLDNVPTGTKAAFILPNTKLDKDGGKKLLKNHTLETIVRLPSKTFINVGVETAIFIFTAGIPHPKHQKIQGYYIQEDGLETVKNQGRHDINGLWENDYEDYWVAAIANHEDDRYGTHRRIDPSERLSYPDPEVPFELNMEDFMKVAMDYHIFETGVDSNELKDRMKQLQEAVLFDTFYGLESEGIL